MEIVENINIELDFIRTGLILTITEERKYSLFRNTQRAWEPEVQLFEGSLYHYAFNESDFELCCDQATVVRPVPNRKDLGRIEPNIFVGTLELFVVDSEQTRWPIEVEVQSIKTDYRTDYQIMMGFITDQSIDLLYDSVSPSSHRFTVDPDIDPQTLYQRFAFLKSMLENSDFEDAVHRVVSFPVTRWSEEIEQIPFGRIKRHDRKTIKQLVAQRGGSAAVPISHTLHTRVNSVPRFIHQIQKTDTVDTPENRFIKFVLLALHEFVSSLLAVPSASKKLKREATVVSERLEEFLQHEFFKDVGKATKVKLNSPVLQRKEGYREILGVWLKFDMAARLIWEALDDDYKIGKKDVAKLYEYWLFFQLLNLISEKFQLTKKPSHELIEYTEAGIQLRLKEGKHVAIDGIYNSQIRPLNVRFSYNKSFKSNETYSVEGSWSLQMRPDYTLSIWPLGITDKEAEEQELITHIHFDAKYKIEGFLRLFDELNKDLENPDEETKQAQSHKKADFLKMHAYKDAIRRTGGAYVLYPGTDKRFDRIGFHEVVPGLGAFALKPGSEESGIIELRKFLEDLVKHFEHRLSKREKLALKKYQISKANDVSRVEEPLPENFGNKRTETADETYVLVGYRQDKQKSFIDSKGWYNIRIDDLTNLAELSSQFVGAKYLLLYNNSELQTADLYEIKNPHPSIWTKQKLLEEGYVRPSKDFYLMFSVTKCSQKELVGRKWDVSKLDGYSSKGYPFVISLADLMNKVSIT